MKLSPVPTYTTFPPQNGVVPTDGSPPLGVPLNPSLPSHRATTNFSPVRTVVAPHVTYPVSSTSTVGVASAFVVAVKVTPALYLLAFPLP